MKAGWGMPLDDALPTELMPREKLVRDPGGDSLSETELLALLLGTGTRDCSVIELAHRLLSAFASLDAFAQADWLEMKAAVDRYNEAHPSAPIKGVAETKLQKLAAAFQFVRRVQARQNWDFRRNNLRSSAAAYRVFDRIVRAAPEKEHFFMLPMDSDYHALCEPVEISQGSVNRVPVHPRDVFCEAVRYRAFAVIVAHNHPCGDPTPSEEDLEITKRLVETGHVLGIPVLDHLVIGASDSNGGSGYVSVRAQGVLSFSVTPRI